MPHIHTHTVRRAAAAYTMKQGCRIFEYFPAQTPPVHPKPRASMNTTSVGVGPANRQHTVSTLVISAFLLFSGIF